MNNATMKTSTTSPFISDKGIDYVYEPKVGVRVAVSHIQQAFIDGWRSLTSGARNHFLLTSDSSDAWVLGRWAAENGIDIAVAMTVKKSRGYTWKMNGKMYRVNGVAVSSVDFIQ
jgi:hypothetical protein